MNIKFPKYDNDLVTLGYLNDKLKQEEEKTSSKINSINKNWGSQPQPPYHKGDTWIDNDKIYRCIKDRNIGSFSIDDWTIVIDSNNTDDFISGIFLLEKIGTSDQADGKIETFYQDSDPSINWNTNLIKDMHVGDFWWNKNSTYIYTRYGTNPISYKFVETTITHSIFNLTDGHKNIFLKRPSSYSKYDIWIINVNDENIPPNAHSGEWYYATKSSDTFFVEDFSIKDDDTSIKYLQSYYTKNEILSKIEEVEKKVESDIKKYNDAILLSVSEEYTDIKTTEEIQKTIDGMVENVSSVVNEQTTQTARLSQMEISSGIISEQVSSLQTIYDENKNKISQIENTVQQNITDTFAQFKIINNVLDNGVEKLKNNLVTIDVNGISVSYNDENFKALMTNKNFAVTDGINEIAFFGYDENLQKTIARIKELETERVTAGYHRCEGFTDGLEKRTGWFYVGGVD